MPRKPPPVVEELPFLMIDEGVKKNRASERLRQYLVTKMSERAAIEMKYIKMLQGWLDDFNPFYNQEGGSEVYIDSELVKKLIAVIKSDVIQMMSNRQKVYNDVMSDEGAYNNLVEIRTHCQNGKNLQNLMEEFAIINDRKTELDLLLRKHMDRKSHLSNEVEELERQLAQRSRIAVNRRGSERGAKKIDDMKNKLSRLRRQTELEADKVKGMEKELFDIGTSTKTPLEALDNQLRELEDRRIRAILNHTRQYLLALQGTGPQISPPIGFKGRPKFADLESVDGLLKSHWSDVRTNAKRSEAGEKFKLRELFTVKQPKAKVEYRDEINDGRDSRMSNNTGKTQGIKKTRDSFFSRKSKKNTEQGSTRNPLPDDEDRDSPSPESYSADGRRSRLNFTEEYFQDDLDSQRMRDRTELDSRMGQNPPIAKSDESIEELELPPETWCPADVTRQYPNRQFLIKKGNKKSKDSTDSDAIPVIPSVHFTEYSRVSDYQGNEIEEEQQNLGKMRNVRVIAIQDHLAPTAGSELSFRKGQLIKQKVGRNEDGFCYGWIRDSPMGRKRYGYYRLNMVRQHDAKQDAGTDDNSD